MLHCVAYLKRIYFHSKLLLAFIEKKIRLLFTSSFSCGMNGYSTLDKTGYCKTMLGKKENKPLVKRQSKLRGQ